MVIFKVLYSLAPSFTSEASSEVTRITRRAASKLIPANLPRMGDQASSLREKSTQNVD